MLSPIRRGKLQRIKKREVTNVQPDIQTWSCHTKIQTEMLTCIQMWNTACKAMGPCGYATVQTSHTGHTEWWDPLHCKALNMTDTLCVRHMDHTLWNSSATYSWNLDHSSHTTCRLHTWNRAPQQNLYSNRNLRIIHTQLLQARLACPEKVSVTHVGFMINCRK